MKKLLVFVLSLAFASSKVFAQDYIIQKNGKEHSVKINQIDREKVYFINQEQQEDELSLKDVYMLRTKSRGNVYYTIEGKLK